MRSLSWASCNSSLLQLISLPWYLVKSKPTNYENLVVLFPPSSSLHVTFLPQWLNYCHQQNFSNHANIIFYPHGQRLTVTDKRVTLHTQLVCFHHSGFKTTEVMKKILELCWVRLYCWVCVERNLDWYVSQKFGKIVVQGKVRPFRCIT